MHHVGIDILIMINDSKSAEKLYWRLRYKSLVCKHFIVKAHRRHGNEAARSGRFITGETRIGNYCKGGWLGPKASSYLYREMNPGPSAHTQSQYWLRFDTDDAKKYYIYTYIAK